jgi:hypothetical protein
MRARLGSWMRKMSSTVSRDKFQHAKTYKVIVSRILDISTDSFNNYSPLPLPYLAGAGRVKKFQDGESIDPDYCRNEILNSALMKNFLSLLGLKSIGRVLA